jgi:sterol desaturase/sphingolipid hydroxylase (fatty acid hydroxylase superfamily)
MDSATAFRFHPLDALLDTATAVGAGAIFGLDSSIILFFFFLYLPLLFAQHSNFIFPAWTDKLLGSIFAVPNFHKVHHHQQQEFTDSNYGNLFIFWDKLFGTFKFLPVKEIKFGLEEFDDQKKQTAWYLIKSPFLKIVRIKGEDKSAVT